MSAEEKEGRKKRKNIKNKPKNKNCLRAQGQNKALSTHSQSLEFTWEKQYTLN